MAHRREGVVPADEGLLIPHSAHSFTPLQQNCVANLILVRGLQWIGNRKFPVVSGARAKSFCLVGLRPLSFWFTCEAIELNGPLCSPSFEGTLRATVCGPRHTAQQIIKIRNHMRPRLSH